VTTLNTLFQAQKKSRLAVVGPLKLLTISQPDTPGERSLPMSTMEVEKLVQVVCAAGWSGEDIVRLNGADATVNRVSGALDTCSWVHFACHGVQDSASGMKSAFTLHDGALELNQIASKRLSIGQFAFLSVCHGASGLRELPGEAMHLAAGLQFTGFPSVVATLWGISDEDAPKIADQIYKYLFRNRVEGLDPSEAATALNRAVLCLREDPTVTLDRWAPFIHFGIW
jgi:CHAT domain-containing protein